MYNQRMWIPAALLGWLIGVLINLLADRLPRTRRIERPRCGFCDGPRTPDQASALLALVLGRRACAYCGAKRPLRGLFVELVSIAAATAIAWQSTSWRAWGVQTWFLSLYALMFVIDLEHRLILHVTSVPAIVSFTLLRGLDPSVGWSKTLWGGFAGLLMMLLFYLAGGLFSRWMSRRRKEPIDEVAFGFGDVMLGCAIGLDVGWSGVVLALFTGILAAGLFSLITILYHLLRRRYRPFMAIPYGPFLILGAVWFQLAGRTLILGLAGGG